MARRINDLSIIVEFDAKLLPVPILGPQLYRRSRTTYSPSMTTPGRVRRAA
jgi:hypothetical protein